MNVIPILGALPSVTDFTGITTSGSTIFEAVAVIILAVLGFGFMKRMLKGRG